jgi:NAD(P) transhydrogenase subunit alpha
MEHLLNPTVIQLYVFVLAGFVGFMVITRVPPLLHTPLMSATNAISAISLVGSLVFAGLSSRTTGAGGTEIDLEPNVLTGLHILGFVAVTAATINVVGGFLITDRMLKMFKHQEPKKLEGPK